MDIRFCSICNESIPDTDFEAGRAFSSAGRTAHVACSLGRLTEERRPRNWLVPLLALYAAGVGTFLLVSHLSSKGSESEPAAVSAPVKDHVQSALHASEVRQKDRMDSSLASMRTELETRIAAQGPEKWRQRQEEALASLQASLLEGDRQLGSRLLELEKRMNDLDPRLASLSAWFQKIQEQADSLGEAMDQLRGDKEPVAAADPAPSPTPPISPATGPGPGAVDESLFQRLVRSLEHEDAEIVFTATIELGKIGDRRAIPALVKVFQEHKDLYSRMGAAVALGQLRACDGVEPLIKALTDSDLTLRSTAGRALVEITGENLGYNGDLPPAERTKIQRRYERWWEENEAELRQKLKQPAAGG